MADLKMHVPVTDQVKVDGDTLAKIDRVDIKIQITEAALAS